MSGGSPRAGGPSGLRLRLSLGAAAWIVFVIAQPSDPFSERWAQALLLLAPLVLVPLGLELAAPPGTVSGGVARLIRGVRAAQLPAALLLAAALALHRGGLAAGLALPWLALTGAAALLGLLRWIDRRRGAGEREQGGRSLAELAVDAGLVYLAVGGAWVVADRLGLRPLGFSPVIVLLTGIHFHYAGFVLPLVTGLVLRSRAGGAAGILAGAGVIAGVPAVAVGITATQVGLPPWIEALAALLLASTGMLVAWLHLRLAAAPGGGPTPPRIARLLWPVSALSLLFSMVLAGLYGARFYLDVAWLNIPWMRALHGSANAFGFALAALAGWGVAGSGRPTPIDRRSGGVALMLAGLLVCGLLACRPDPYALLLRTLEPGERVELPGERTLVFEEREGTTLRGVRLEGPAGTCSGSMVLEAPEARLERVEGEHGAAVARVVLERPVAVERCGEITSRTTHERLTVTLPPLG